MRIRYIDPNRLKVLMMMFLGTGIMGLIMGLQFAPAGMTMILTFMGVVNIALCAFFAFTYLTQTRSEPDKRKKKKKRD
jgi:phosphotransferase system  glucose/maltose/N-acetylglucosamine-specific IIC component